MRVFRTAILKETNTKNSSSRELKDVQAHCLSYGQQNKSTTLAKYFSWILKNFIKVI